MIYRFEDFELDPARFELRKAGTPVAAEPQVLSLLLLLVSNPDRLVSKDEIIEKIWNNRIVSEAAVAARVKSARKALDDNGRQQRFLRTVHGKGFRFVGDVEFVSTAPPSASKRPDDDPVQPQAALDQDRPSIAVLPFRLAGEAGHLGFMADALADELIADLARLRWLFVIARGSSFRFRGPAIDYRQAGQALGIRYCLSGGLAFAAGHISISRNWDVIGLRGTGSHDVVVDEVRVSQEWTFVRGGPSTLEAPLFRYPVMSLAAQVLAVVGLGVARTALDTLIEMANGRGSITGAPVLADRAYVQNDVAQAEASLRSARSFFYEITEDAYAILQSGDPLPIEKVNLLRLASTHVAAVGVEVSQVAYKLSGTTGIYKDHPIARNMNDALVVAQHAFLASGTWQNAGRVLLGLESVPGFP